MPKIVLGENLRHALKERALPGFYWGITAGGTLFALIPLATARGTKGFEVLVFIFSVLVLVGIVLGALVTYLWREGRSSSRLPDSESGRTWKIVPAIFGILGISSAVLLNWFLNSNTNQKDLVTTAVAVLIFCLNFWLVGCGLGSLGWLGVDHVRNQGWELPRPRVPVWGTADRSAPPSGGPSRRGRLQVVRSHLGEIGLALVVLLLLGLVGMWLTTPYTPTKQNSSGAPLAPATATIVVLPSPTALPTATSAPTVPPMPPPPTGAPITQPTAGPTVKPTTAVLASPTLTIDAKPTATKPLAVPLVCSYKAQSGDTWTTISQKLGVTVGDLMKRNQGLNPAQPGTVFKSPRSGCP